MGMDEMAVTDPQGRVYGIGNLRIVDASLMPLITSGNTNAPTIMIGEKVADHIKGRCEASINAEFYRSNNWQRAQRDGVSCRVFTSA